MTKSLWQTQRRLTKSFTSDLVSLDANEQITMADSASFGLSHHRSSASLDQDYVWTWHHWVQMGKSLPFELTNLEFEGPEPGSKVQ
ncbi:hypothetical protein V6N13_072668 [Hibiscus sabdariffa]|uniref:Uncharacterized protein n=1 Tax=Hibiscus sabdariffa TaxID=183260 RepID=A0ABR2E8A1_9ROSI